MVNATALIYVQLVPILACSSAFLDREKFGVILPIGMLWYSTFLQSSSDI